MGCRAMVLGPELTRTPQPELLEAQAMAESHAVAGRPGAAGSVWDESARAARRVAFSKALGGGFVQIPAAAGNGEAARTACFHRRRQRVKSLTQPCHAFVGEPVGKQRAGTAHLFLPDACLSTPALARQGQPSRLWRQPRHMAPVLLGHIDPPSPMTQLRCTRQTFQRVVKAITEHLPSSHSAEGRRRTLVQCGYCYCSRPTSDPGVLLNILNLCFGC